MDWPYLSIAAAAHLDKVLTDSCWHIRRLERECADVEWSVLASKEAIATSKALIASVEGACGRPS